ERSEGRSCRCGANAVAFPLSVWYDAGMEIDFGQGLTLIEASPYLRDAQERVERILDVVERDSVVNALPPFSVEFRRGIIRQPMDTSAHTLERVRAVVVERIGVCEAVTRPALTGANPWL